MKIYIGNLKSHMSPTVKGAESNVFSCKLRFLFKTLGLIRSSRTYTNSESGLIPNQIHVQTA